MKRLFVTVAFAAVLQVIGSAAAQNFPSHPIALIVPFPPGGPTDTVARIISERMRGSLGQPVVVENVSGAGGTIGAGRVASAAPDGYTIGLGQWTSHVGGGVIYPLQFDMLKDFEPISLLTTAPLWIVAKKDMPANNLKEMIAWLKANPSKASAGSVGVGSAAQLCIVDLQNRTGTSFQTVPYRGGAPALQDLVAGQIDFACLEASQTMAQYRAGKIKVFGVAGETRWPPAPEVPTLDEAGVAGVHIAFWHGLWAPRGTPKEIVAKLNAAVVESFADPAVRKRFDDIGHVIPSPDRQTPAALYAHHKAEIEKWGPIIKAANIKAPTN